MWTPDSILTVLIRILSKGRDSDDSPEIGPTTRLKDVADLDSLAMVEFVMMIEDTFGVGVIEKVMGEMTLQEIADEIYKKLL